MIILQAPLVCHFFEEHQVRHRKIMGIIHHQALGPRLVQMSHELRLASAPMSSDRHAERCKKLVAQCLLIVIVFGSHHRENGSSASSFLQVADARRFASTRIGNNDMPGTDVPGGTQHGLEPASKGGLDEWVRSEGGWRHGYSSSHIWRIGKIRTGRSESASGTALLILDGASFFVSISASRSVTSAGWISPRSRSH